MLARRPLHLLLVAALVAGFGLLLPAHLLAHAHGDGPHHAGVADADGEQHPVAPDPDAAPHGACVTCQFANGLALAVAAPELTGLLPATGGPPPVEPRPAAPAPPAYTFDGRAPPQG